MSLAQCQAARSHSTGALEEAKAPPCSQGLPPPPALLLPEAWVAGGGFKRTTAASPPVGGEKDCLRRGNVGERGGRTRDGWEMVFEHGRGERAAER